MQHPSSGCSGTPGSRRGTLRQFAADTFNNGGSQLDCDKIRLPKALNAWTLDAVAGIKIHLTDNLSKHLLMVDDDTNLYVFHHATYLEYQYAQGEE